jgi:hypothetical protein
MPWHQVHVTKAGPAENGTVYIALKATDGSFHYWYVAHPQLKKEMLATALAAMSGAKLADVFLTGTAQYSTINRLYMAA